MPNVNNETRPRTPRSALKSGRKKSDDAMSLSKTFVIRSCLFSVSPGNLFSGNKTYQAHRKPKKEDANSQYQPAPTPVVVKETNLERVFSKKEKEWEATVTQMQFFKDLSHLFLAKFHSCWLEGSVLYYEREYLLGSSLDEVIVNRNGDPLLEDHMLDWISHITLALRYLHDQGIFHRNLKSSNVYFVTDRDGYALVKIADLITQKVFDESRGLMANSSLTGMSVAGHFAPELLDSNIKNRTTNDANRRQGSADYDGKIDVWALGVILYQMATFQHPFALSTWESTVEAITTGERKPIPDKLRYSSSLTGLIDKMLAIHPNDRPSIVQLAEDMAYQRLLSSFMGAVHRGDLAKLRDISTLVNNDMAIIAAREKLELPETGQALNAETIEALVDATGDTALHKAARYGRRQVAFTLLELGFDVGLLNDRGDTPLHVAAASGSVDVAILLIENNAKLVAKGQQNRTALHFAVERDNVTLVRLLLSTCKSGRSAFLETKEAQLGATALHLACWIGANLDTVDALLSAGALITAKDNDGDSPLHIAAYRGHFRVAELLLNRGAPLEATNGPRLGRTPLHTAAENNQLDIVQLFLVRHANPNVVDSQAGSTPLHLACQFGYLMVVEALFVAGADKEAQDGTGDRPIHRAAAGGHAEVVTALLTHDVKADPEDPSGKTPLFMAALEGHARVIEVLMRLGGVDIEGRENQFGNMPIHVAAAQGHRDVVRVFVSKDPTLANRPNDPRRGKGRTPLHLAVVHGCVGVVDYLLSQKTTDTSLKDTHEKTAFLLMKHDLLLDNDDIDETTKSEMVHVFRRHGVQH